MSKIIIFIFLTTSLFSNIDLKEIQDEFNNDAIKLNLKHNFTKEDFEKRLRLHKLYTQLDKAYIKRLKIKVKNKLVDKKLKENEFISVIDLKKQLFILVLKQNNKFNIIGVDLISSGEINKEIEVRYGEDHYFRTPSGIYSINAGWRSDGSFKKDNVTLKYGKKDRFVYYIGKVDTIRYNTFTPSKEKITKKENWQLWSDKVNLAMHSYTQSAVLGVKDSHGCIRISNELNAFLDKNNVLYKHFYTKNRWTLKYSNKPRNSKNKNLAGEYLIIFDKI